MTSPSTTPAPAGSHSGAGASSAQASAALALDVNNAKAIEEWGEEVVESPKPANAKKSLWERIEAGLSRLSTRNNFWHRICSLIWLPYAFKSGITMKRLGPNTFAAILPFRRVNRNWYNAMAGAALLGNSEIAGGMFVFGICGGDYTVVCKQMQYKFLRPCFGPAIYRITPREDIRELLKSSDEFNITLDMQIVQQPLKRSDRVKIHRVGRCEVTFHVAPKAKIHRPRKR